MKAVCRLWSIRSRIYASDMHGERTAATTRERALGAVKHTL